MEKVRFGILGASSVAQYALIAPARGANGIEATVLGTRDPASEASRDYAARNGLPRLATYEAVLADPSVDAVYVGLPNGLHRDWTIRALEAGKAVLCEKPLAANADQAEAMFAAAGRTGGLLVEGLHWRWHPLARRIAELALGGSLGRIERVRARFLIPRSTDRGGFRGAYDLAGGATMDAGVYCLDLIRYVLGEPERVASASAIEGAPQVDMEMKASLAFAGGATGEMHVSRIRETEDFVIDAEIVGERASLRVNRPFVPHWDNWIELNGEGREQLDLTPSFDFQARGFAALVRGRGENLAPTANSLANMRAIDAVYRAAGLRRRGEA
jgi:predicted dehydrogenase